MRPVGLRAILCRRPDQLPALKGPRAGSDRSGPAIVTKSCSKRLNGGAKVKTKNQKDSPELYLKTHFDRPFH